MAEAETITTDVLVAGAGPAGLLLARELQIAGVTAMVIDKLPQRSLICRGFTLNARSLDILARRSTLEPFLAEGWKVPHAAFSGLPVTPVLEGAATDHPFTLGIGQDRVERLLEAQAIQAGVCIHWGHELLSFEQNDAGITAAIGGSGRIRRVRARYLAGCDGSRSAVRKQAGIAFPGTPATRIMLLGDVELADPDCLSLGANLGPGGKVFVIPRPGYVRILVRDPQPPAEKDKPLGFEEFTGAVSTALGKQIALRNPRWLTRFGDAARLAERYVAGRVVLAGDAAHIHPPAGAIGVNVALDDAFNLGWKLAATVRGAPGRLIESYHRERHAAGKRVLENTQAQVLLAEESDESSPIREFLTRFFRRRDVNVALAEVLTCLDTQYERPSQEDTNPWLGRMIPDFALRFAGKDTRLAALLSEGRGLLIDATEGAQFMRAVERPPANLCAVATASLPPAVPQAMLVRPDGHAAWISNKRPGEANELREAIDYWFSGP